MFWYKPLTDTPNVLNGQMEDDKPILTDTKKTRRTRNTRHVVHSDEESENLDSQEKDESISVVDKKSKKKGIQKDSHVSFLLHLLILS